MGGGSQGVGLDTDLSDIIPCHAPHLERNGGVRKRPGALEQPVCVQGQGTPAVTPMEMCIALQSACKSEAVV